MIEEIEREGLTLMHLRNVPTNPACPGKGTTRAAKPDIKQVFITGVTRCGQSGTRPSLHHPQEDRKARAATDFYIVSLSAKNIIYKGMLSSMQVREVLPGPDATLLYQRIGIGTLPVSAPTHFLHGASPNRSVC